MFDFKSVKDANFSSNWTMLKFDLLLSHFALFFYLHFKEKGTFCFNFEGENKN